MRETDTKEMTYKSYKECQQYRPEAACQLLFVRPSSGAAHGEPACYARHTAASPLCGGTADRPCGPGTSSSCAGCTGPPSAACTACQQALKAHPRWPSSPCQWAKVEIPCQWANFEMHAGVGCRWHQLGVNIVLLED